ncbi:MAG TPA: DUF6065 family protein [Tepidisphaeraceae bacterium]|nr:DUF6065 family protein [Tepidisphaeraceae bacterium]
MSVIRFDATPVIRDSCPHPYPASRGLPQWLKKTPMDLERENWSTVKRCPPFLEAMTAGYIIPLAEDCSFTRGADGRINVKSHNNIVEGHAADQYSESPFSHYPVAKFLNPWGIVTEPGYSTLFIAPINRWEIPFFPLSGVVETDTYYNHINFPAICTLAPGSQCVLPRGTPLIQAIPFRREEWKMEIGEMDNARVQQMRDQLDANPHTYKEQYWLKHQFD